MALTPPRSPIMAWKELMNKAKVGQKPPNQPAPSVPSAPRGQADPNQLIEQQFANLRSQRQAAKDEAKRAQEQELNRALSASGGFGGAEQKIRRKAGQELERSFGEESLGIASQEAGAKLQESMFAREFSENQKTNMVNALNALKASGFLDTKESVQRNILNFLNRFGGIYEGRTPAAAPGAKRDQGGGIIY